MKFTDTPASRLDAQQAKLTEAGAETIFSGKESGAKKDRKALQKALAALEPGDVLLEVYPGPSQHAGHGCQGRGRVSFAR